MSKTIKHSEVTINNKWIHARITKFDPIPNTAEDQEYMVVFRNSEGVKDITFYKWESLALEKYQKLLEDNFLNFPFKQKVESEISVAENYLHDPQ